AILIALPFYAGEGEKSWHRRPVAVIILVFVAVLWGIFTHLGTHTPWSPKMDAWSQDTVPVKYLQNLTPVQRQGAVIFQGMQCRNCHSLDDIGGRRGPMLDDVAMRLTEDQLIRQVVQGGGNMPAYGKNLSPPQVTALVQFLETLHPPNQRPASDASLAIEKTIAPNTNSIGSHGSGATIEPPIKPPTQPGGKR